MTLQRAYSRNISEKYQKQIRNNYEQTYQKNKSENISEQYQKQIRTNIRKIRETSQKYRKDQSQKTIPSPSTSPSKMISASDATRASSTILAPEKRYNRPALEPALS